MIDGITLNIKIQDLEVWKKKTNIKFNRLVDTETGEVLVKRRFQEITSKYFGKWGSFYLEITEISNPDPQYNRCYLKIRGSLHKNHYQGKNYQEFTWSDLKYQINHLCKSLHINSENAKISNLEVGINLKTFFPVSDFIDQSVIDYKGKYFKSYSESKIGIEIGKFCELSQYVIKLYDKGLQNSLDMNLIRIEQKFIKMHKLNQIGISVLSDLLNKEKVYKLKFIIFDAWKNILVHEIDNLEEIKEKIGNDYELMLRGKTNGFWNIEKSKCRDRYNYLRQKFKEINTRYGSRKHEYLLSMITQEWDK